MTVSAVQAQTTTQLGVFHFELLNLLQEPLDQRFEEFRVVR